jgi:hypothetical protein
MLAAERRTIRRQAPCPAVHVFRALNEDIDLQDVFGQLARLRVPDMEYSDETIANSGRGTWSKQNRLPASRCRESAFPAGTQVYGIVRRAGEAQLAYGDQQDAEVDRMATVKLDKGAWHTYFDRISKLVVGKQAEIEVASLKLGDQIEAEWVPLLGITYDPKNDLVEVLLEGLDHLIRNPRDIYIDQGPAGLTSMEVVDTDDVRQIIRLRDPVMLPPPSH